VELRLLGPVTAEDRGAPVPLGPPQSRFLLAVLALEINRLVPMERIIDLLWLDPPRSAYHAIHVSVSRLRSVLRGVPGVELEGGRSGYLLRADQYTVDAHRFRARLERARAADDGTRVRLLDEALALWTGPALADVAPPEARQRLVQGLEEARLAAVEDRLEALLRLGQHGVLLNELPDLVAARPVRERLVGQLMLTLYRRGRTTEALATYREAKRRLADELGLDPSAELRRLESAILRGDPSLAAPAAPPPDAPAATGDKRIRVVVVDDHPMYRSGLKVALETGTDVVVVGEAANVQEATGTVARAVPDVVLMDLHLPDGSGVDATRQLLVQTPGLPVLVVTMSEEDEAIVSALRAGARGYLLKSASRDEILSAIRTVGCGGSVFSSQIAARLAALAAPDEA
jgi:DNA-binding SARP family transcriptional activator/CheY-like chemotaxis protein